MSGPFKMNGWSPFTQKDPTKIEHSGKLYTKKDNILTNVDDGSQVTDPNNLTRVHEGTDYVVDDTIHIEGGKVVDVKRIGPKGEE